MVCSAEILENRLRAPLWAHILYVRDAELTPMLCISVVLNRD